MTRTGIAAALAAIVLAAATPATAVSYGVSLDLAGLVLDHDTGANLTGSATVRVTGTIVTDGTFGALTAANVLSWSFTVADATSSRSFASAGLFGLPEAGGLELFSATAAELSVAPGFWYFSEYALAGGTERFAYLAGIGSDLLAEDADRDLLSQVASRGAFAMEAGAIPPGSRLVLGRAPATEPGPAPVPLPAPLLLLAAALGLAGLLVRPQATA